MDVDGVLAHFADDATLTVQTDHVTFDGADEIRRMFTDFFAASVSIRHEIRNIVVEEAAREGRHRAGLHRRAEGRLEERHAQLQLLRLRRRREVQARDHLDGGHKPAQVARSRERWHGTSGRALEVLEEERADDPDGVGRAFEQVGVPDVGKLVARMFGFSAAIRRAPSPEGASSGGQRMSYVPFVISSGRAICGTSGERSISSMAMHA